jgi:hypothetical protein
MFVRACDQRFDERFGVGSIYGAYEDTDFVFCSVISGSVLYNPKIQVLHPDEPTSAKSRRKNFSYGIGFGAFIAKNLSFQNCFLLAGVVIYHALQSVKSILLLDLGSAMASAIAFISRPIGVAIYARNECKQYVNKSHAERRLK